VTNLLTEAMNTAYYATHVGLGASRNVHRRECFESVARPPGVSRPTPRILGEAGVAVAAAGRNKGCLIAYGNRHDTSVWASRAAVSKGKSHHAGVSASFLLGAIEMAEIKGRTFLS